MVSFRQGSNVEFGPGMEGGMSSTNPQPSSTKLGETASAASSDFSNPMYEAVQQQSTSSSGGGSTAPTISTAAAIIPASVVHQSSSPQIQIRQFDVTEEDTGKDTQNLITEAGSSSEC